MSTTREIKFRQFNTLSKKMEPFTEKSDVEICKDGTLQTYMPKNILLQFTGLHDKNGRECYEGDKIKNRLTDHHGTVVYTDEFATFNVVDAKGKWVCSMGAMGSDGFEIIGNIYEN